MGARNRTASVAGLWLRGGITLSDKIKLMRLFILLSGVPKTTSAKIDMAKLREAYREIKFRVVVK